MNRLISKLILGLLLLMSFNAHAYDDKSNTSVLGCEAVFLEQAFNLKWDSIRLSNRHPKDSLWVVCPIHRNASATPSDGLSLYINYRYSSRTDYDTPELACYFRDINEFGTVEYTQIITASNPGPDTSDYTGVTIDSDLLSDSLYNYWTMSCKLPPGTSLHSFDIYE